MIEPKSFYFGYYVLLAAVSLEYPPNSDPAWFTIWVMCLLTPCIVAAWVSESAEGSTKKRFLNEEEALMMEELQQEKLEND